ncbi:acetyl-CoA synthetase-like protein [Guyanagaster necrorhizus]|uniref:Acetyl-CoA synthetase-like protein n=1 Tax=Guyanagaster necrorhizus TaxID=856835 RepID=A0A9P7VVG1_9AGAR|nr:acetyl-CoA synthetase-like protein [Guyanagaster necrorhizus MCA 3950]KAG7447195.1 acetyl-CoA synthetase-like protein [Guyanagaster necrorhizus MCA 3950]
METHPAASALAYPPLDGSLLLHEFPDFHLRHNPSHPLFVYAENDGKFLHEISHLEFCRAVHRVAHAVNHIPRMVPVGVLALTDTIFYHALFLGLMKAGHTPYLLSPRNSAAATAKLLQDVGSRHLVASPIFKALIREIRLELELESPVSLSVFELPSLDSVFPKLGFETREDPFTPYMSTRRSLLTDVAFYLHSSGSTGFPKTIPQTQTSILHWCSFQSIRDLIYHPNLRIGGFMLPSFHTLGIYFQILTPLVGLRTVAVYPPLCKTPTSQPFTPSPGSVLEHIARTQSNSVVAIPAIIEVWASIPAAVDVLRKLQIVWYSGGTLSAKVGNSLHASGVTLTSVYGATEFGAPVHTMPLAADVKAGEWSWIRFDSQATIQMLPHGDGLFEAHFMSTEKHHVSVHNLTDGLGYATADLFQKHPTKDLWKIAARTDEVIVLSSGEKAIPGPTEDIINSSPLILGSVMFGREQPQVGIIVQPKSAVSDEGPVIEEANHQAPAFSKIYRDMIIVAPLSKSLPRSSKGSIHRKLSLEAFSTEISNLRVSVKVPSDWSSSKVYSWLLDQATDVMGSPILPEIDFFQQGFDSLSASILRHHITSAMRASPIEAVRQEAEHFTLDCIYKYPSVRQLSASFDALSKGSSHVSHVSENILESMISRYGAFSAVRASPVDSAVSMGSEEEDQILKGSVVLLTGSTGSLGSHVLARLISSSDIQAVYCLNRTSSQSTLKQRQRSMFKRQGLDVTLLDSTKVFLIEGNMTEERFGLDDYLFRRMLSSVNVIVHAAWRVDFNLTLPSFEPNIEATRNLINFALDSKHSTGTRFVFVSSVTSVQSWTGQAGVVPESAIDNWKVAVGRGYGEAKYVAERLTLRKQLLSRSGLRGSSLRVGQLCGGSHVGAWSTTEWFPILVKSSIAINALPSFSGVVSWMTVQSVAQIILDIAFNPEAEPMINLVHPKPVPWASIITQVQHALKEDIPVKPASEWFEILETRSQTASSEDMQQIPALKLLAFFREMIQGGDGSDSDQESGGLPRFSTSKAEKYSSTMLNVKPIGSEEVEGWVQYWKEVGFLRR